MSTLKVNSITNLNNEAQFGPVLMTAQASTSGTNIDFTGIPSWAKRITVLLSGVSLSGTAQLLFQIGSGSVTTSGYNSGSAKCTGTSITSNVSTTGFNVNTTAAAEVISGQLVVNLVGSNVYASSHSCGSSTANAGWSGGGAVTLSGVLDRIRVTTSNGTDAFDAGTINVMYE